ncbi:hypothetical protein BA6E_121144 [Bacteroidales bacterium 6E]|nr:hypothetical protein BA6E_121144 [Bacteroidales bacterium 6E]
MASIRSLKKDIDYLMSLVLEECLYVMENLPEAEQEKAMEIARKIVAGHYELRMRVNHPDGKDNPAIVKTYMKKVVDDLYAKANSALEELSALTGK